MASISEIPYQFMDQLKCLEFVKEIWLFGSRARQDHSKRSDIDLVIVCPTATRDDWLKVLEIVEKADTLLKIDILRFEEIDDLQFKKRVEREKKVVFKR